MCIDTDIQLQRAHAVTELARDLKQAVAKEKRRRLKAAAGLEAQRLRSEFEQDLVFLEQASICF